MEQPQVFSRPLPPGLVTIRDWAGETGHEARSVHANWKTLGGFPPRAGVIPGPGRNGGGLPEDVYIRAELNDWRAVQASAWGRRSVWLIVGHGEDEVVGLAAFAGLAGLEAPGPGEAGLPSPAGDGAYRLGDLIAWQNARPPSAGHLLAATALGPGELVTVAAFARLIGVQDKSVSQYGEVARLRKAGDGRRCRLGELADWWNRRPGKAGPRPRRQALTGGLERIPLSGPARQVVELADSSGLRPRLSPAAQAGLAPGRTAVSVGAGRGGGPSGVIIVGPSGRLLHGILRDGSHGPERRYSGTGAVREVIASWAAGQRAGTAAPGRRPAGRD